MGSQERVRARETSTPLAELEEALQIDEDALDESLIRQPDAFYRVSKRLALLISRRDAAKQAYTEEEARAEQRIRRDADRGDYKVTVNEVHAEVRLDKDVKEAAQVLLDLNRQVNELTALKEAFQQRSYVLKDLVNLYVANYYGDVTSSSANRDAKDRAASRNREALREERRNRNR